MEVVCKIFLKRHQMQIRMRAKISYELDVFSYCSLNIQTCSESAVRLKKF